jgi:hypothetical protein
MLKTSMIVACVLAASTTAAFAQTISVGATGAPNGTDGAAPTRYVGSNPNVAANFNGSSTSSSMLEQRLKEESAAGLPTNGEATPPAAR